jgi:hypothetical protein
MTEDKIQNALVLWLSYVLPKDVIVITNPYMGMAKTGYQAAKAKKAGLRPGQPDFIFIGKTKCQKAGVAIELKAVSIYKKDGSLKKSEHLERQFAELNRYEKQGFAAHFSVGLQATQELIGKYYHLKI